jgi:hypothetical protein
MGGRVRGAGGEEGAARPLLRRTPDASHSARLCHIVLSQQYVHVTAVPGQAGSGVALHNSCSVRVFLFAGSCPWSEDYSPVFSASVVRDKNVPLR